MKDTKAKSETRAEYKVQPHSQEYLDNEIITKALGILIGRLVTKGDSMTAPNNVRDFLQIKMATLEHEVFACMFLDSQNRLIAYDEMFRGTLTQTSVYPREVVKAALTHNAAAVIFAHNHPSGVCEPSRADELLTTTLKSALAMIDVKALDHFIVAGSASPISFAERGLI
jgi:DNA repair protein RadC